MFLFIASSPVLCPPILILQSVSGSMGPDVKLVIHFHLLERLKMRGAVL
jgi:hypothetical protein